MSILNIHNFTDKCNNIKDLEYTILNSNILDDIIEYINVNIIPNCMIESESESEFEFNFDFNSDSQEDIMNVKKMFMTEGTIIITNLSLILNKYIEKKPNNYVNIDTTNPWFLNEPTFVINDGIQNNAFSKNIIIGKVFSILIKLVDFINTQYINKINDYKRKIIDAKMYINSESLLLQRELIDMSAFERIYLNTKFTEMINIMESQRDKILEEQSSFYENCRIIRNYLYSLLSFISNEYNKDPFLMFLPKCILNVIVANFNDIQYIKYIIKFDSWIPSEIRCTYIHEIIELLSKKDLDKETKLIVSQFNPDINYLIKDTNYLYLKYLKDNSLIRELSSLILLISQMFMVKGNVILESKDDLVMFVSILTTLINKIVTEKDQIPDKKLFKLIIDKYFDCIKNVLINNQTVIDSYLSYYLLTLFHIVDKLSDELSNEPLISIFTIFFNNKLSSIYFACTNDIDTIDKIINGKLSIVFNKELRDRIIIWSNIYNKMNDHDKSFELSDNITNCFVVKPYMLPIDEFNYQLCDKYMISTYLWSKPENPYTRSSLTIKELDTFNSTEKITHEIQKITTLLKLTIEECKKDI